MSIPMYPYPMSFATLPTVPRPMNPSQMTEPEGIKSLYSCNTRRTNASGNQPGGLRSNLDHFASGVSAEGVAPDLLPLFYDPQTSGGLLVSVDAAQADAIVAALREADVAAVVVGEVHPRTGYRVELRS